VFSVLRVPFFLEPDYPENEPHVGTNRQRLVKKWGGERGWEEQKRRHDLKGRGLRAGIEHFNLDRLVGNSMNSHRIIQMVGKRYGLDVSEGLYDRFNRYYFVEGHSLNDKPRLAEVTSSTLEGLLPASVTPPTVNDILSFLDGNEGRREIEEAVDTLHGLGIHSIPQFIINGDKLVGGAAEWKVFVDIFRDIIEESDEDGDSAQPVFGNILGVQPDVIQKGSFTLSSV